MTTLDIENIQNLSQEERLSQLQAFRADIINNKKLSYEEHRYAVALLRTIRKKDIASNPRASSAAKKKATQALDLSTFLS